MQEMPSFFDEALRLIVQKQSFEVAQKLLHRERSQVDSTFSLHAEYPQATPNAVNVIMGTDSRQTAELTKQHNCRRKRLYQTSLDRYAGAAEREVTFLRAECPALVSNTHTQECILGADFASQQMCLRHA